MTYDEFIKTLEENEELKQKFLEMMKSERPATTEELGMSASKVAAELGFTIDASEFTLAAITKTNELDDEELDKVAGGWTKAKGEWCIFDYACNLIVDKCVFSNECPGSSYSCKVKAAPCYWEDMIND